MTLDPDWIEGDRIVRGEKQRNGVAKATHFDGTVCLLLTGKVQYTPEGLGARRQLTGYKTSQWREIAGSPSWTESTTGAGPGRTRGNRESGK